MILDKAWLTWHKRWEAGLSRALHMPVKVPLLGMTRVSGAEFLESLPQPTCLYRLQCELGSGSLWLDMNPSILHPMLDRLLGGRPAPERLRPRPLTELELDLAARILDRMLAELEATWSGARPLRLTWEKVKDELRGPAELGLNEPLWLFQLQVNLGSVQGVVSLGWTKELLERLGSQLSAADHEVVEHSRHEDARSGQGWNSHRPTARNERLTLRATLQETTIRREELEELSVGDIITTDHPVDQPLIVTVNGVPRFLASPGILQGRTAFRVLGPIDSPPKLVDAY
jgi:flagellar motor switch protein FliM